MPITVCTQHSSKSLIGIYEELADSYSDSYSEYWKSVSMAMIDIIKLIDKLFQDTTIWGLTSHERLVLLSEDRWDSRWHVKINSIAKGEYIIESAIPEYKSPWPNGTLSGGTQSFDKMKNYIIIAMYESEGWKDNIELEKLYNSIK